MLCDVSYAKYQRYQLENIFVADTEADARAKILFNSLDNKLIPRPSTHTPTAS